MPICAISQDTMESLRAVLDYNWEDETSDYEEQFPEDRTNHVFTHMKRISDWLDDVTTNKGKLAYSIDPYNAPAEDRLDAIIAITYELQKRLDAHRFMLTRVESPSNETGGTP